MFARDSLSKANDFPTMVARKQEFEFNRDHLYQYQAACRLATSPKIPILYPHAFLGPAHLKVLTHDAFPLKLIGTVHRLNHILQIRPLKLGQPYQVELKIGTYRQRPSGFEFDLTTEISHKSRVDWSSISTFLVRDKLKGDDETAAISEGLVNLEEEGEKLTEFKVPKTAGREFAKVTGDYNPIHISSVLAKGFGFKRDLVHGMWGLAKGISYINHLSHQEPMRLDVAFKGPLYMTDLVVVKQSSLDHGRFEFYSGKNPKPCVVGHLRKAQPTETLF